MDKLPSRLHRGQSCEQQRQGVAAHQQGAMVWKVPDQGCQHFMQMSPLTRNSVVCKQLTHRQQQLDRAHWCVVKCIARTAEACGGQAFVATGTWLPVSTAGP